MTNFDDLRDDEFGFDDDEFGSDPMFTNASGDEFDQLRRKSARGDGTNDDLAVEDVAKPSSSGNSFSWSSFSAGQRVILLVLAILNILMIGFGIMVVLGIIG
jgi:hypothetical protein